MKAKRGRPNLYRLDTIKPGDSVTLKITDPKAQRRAIVAAHNRALKNPGMMFSCRRTAKTVTIWRLK